MTDTDNGRQVRRLTAMGVIMAGLALSLFALSIIFRRWFLVVSDWPPHLDIRFFDLAFATTVMLGTYTVGIWYALWGLWKSELSGTPPQEEST